MICRFETIYRDVAAALGESPGLPNLLAEEEEATLPLPFLVRRILPAVAAGTLADASLSDIDTVASFAAPPTACGADCGMIPLPGDFMRLAAFRMPDWETEETDVADERLLLARCKGRIPDVLRRMRTPRNPFLRIARHPDGLFLHFQGTRCPDSTPVSALYVARPHWRSDHSISLPEALYPRIVEAVAAKINDIS